ncbi:MAG TPA: hypothetical protein VGA69_13070 [Nitriliruptorales bacterium]
MPPLTSAGVAVGLALFVLPSALNVPQSNPTQTLEFAPVPPQDDQPPPPDSGNVESLGLGSSSTAPEGAGPDRAGPGVPPPAPPVGRGERPVTKRCVGDPPRQTEDPLAPPCVAHFDGDNGGATYDGVAADEVVIVVYMDDKGVATSSRGSENAPPHGLVDLTAQPEDEEFVKNRVLRAAQRYFNARFQTYGRFVHFYAYYGIPGATPETRRAEAAEIIELVDPFAVVSYPELYAADFVIALAERGVVTFMGRDIYNYEGRAGYTQALYRRFPGLIWSFDPSLDHRAHLFASYVCTKVVAYPVSFSGNPDDSGQPRRLGFLSSHNPEFSEVIDYARLIRERLDACGARIESEATFSNNGGAACSNPPQDAAGTMATFVQDDITTIIWGGRDRRVPVVRGGRDPVPAGVAHPGRHRHGRQHLRPHPRAQRPPTRPHGLHLPAGDAAGAQPVLRRCSRGGSRDARGGHPLLLWPLRRPAPTVHRYPGRGSQAHAGPDGPGVPRHPAAPQ